MQFKIRPQQSNAVMKIIKKSKDGKIHLLKPSPRKPILTKGPMTSKKAHYFTRLSSRKLYATAIARRYKSMPEKTRQGGSVCRFGCKAYID